MSSLEAEITKYAHNVFGALKVTYFNAIYDYCQKLGANFNKVHTGCLLSGYINEQHSQVPGPDGKFGYGGKCFPKDVNAFCFNADQTKLVLLLRAGVHVFDFVNKKLLNSFKIEHLVKKCEIKFVGEKLGVRTDYGCFSLYNV